MWKTLWPWLVWAGLTITMSAFLAHRMKTPDSGAALFLPGPTTHGHHQIEQNCSLCHDPMMGVKEQACYDCHGEDLKAAKDSHPKSKFTDPRNAASALVLDAGRCITCHREHVPDRTRAMGLTLPEDYCAHCHEETVWNRPSHRGLGFNTCAAAGCHNFHDNTALYEGFLERHLAGPRIKKQGQVLKRELLAFFKEVQGGRPKNAVEAGSKEAPAPTPADPVIERDWLETAHAAAGVGCGDCHESRDPVTGTVAWSDRLDRTACAGCHEFEVNTFLEGKHGMRLAQGMTPMTPGQARLPMKAGASHRQLDCTACHGAHRFDTRLAAVESCLGCHDDVHTLAYEGSPHHELWKNEVGGGGGAGTGVSCATCHMPRLARKEGGKEWTRVTHNQSYNFQPNEKMIRSVCVSCHGAGFSIDALADPALIRANFEGPPSSHVESMDWVRERVLEKEQKQ